MKARITPNGRGARESSYKIHHTTKARIKFINLLPFPTIPAWSSVGEPFSETGRESAPPVALKMWEREKEGKRKKKERNMKNMLVVNLSNNDNQLRKLSAIKI
jgi:hypothetical protein